MCHEQTSEDLLSNRRASFCTAKSWARQSVTLSSARVVKCACRRLWRSKVTKGWSVDVCGCVEGGDVPFQTLILCSTAVPYQPLKQRPMDTQARVGLVAALAEQNLMKQPAVGHDKTLA